MITIGFVGLGEMGSRMAGRFLTAGHPVYGTNRTASKAAPLIERGLVWRDTAREVADATDVTFSMVLDDAALEAVASGPDGILAGLAPGKLYVDMSTVSPDASREVAERVRQLGASMLDAPVSGSAPQAEAGSLTIMVGGDAAAFTRVEPILGELGTPTHIGENGQGLLLKLAINISLGVQMLAFAEGLLLAEQSGIDREVAAAEMAASAIGSPMLKARVPLILDLPDECVVRRPQAAEGPDSRARDRPPVRGAVAVNRSRERAAHDGARPRLRRARHRRRLRGARQAGRRRAG
jgi:3-hydroxyisobutyrate dehydrogenase-like beta-hydroxyacid dehydrogenase